MKNKILTGLLVIVAIASVTFAGLKVHSVYEAKQYIGKCYFIESQLTVFYVSKAYMKLEDIDSKYLIEGYVFVLPFKTVLTEEKMRKALAVAKEIPCKGEENEEDTNSSTK